MAVRTAVNKCAAQNVKRRQMNAIEVRATPTSDVTEAFNPTLNSACNESDPRATCDLRTGVLISP